MIGQKLFSQFIALVFAIKGVAIIYYLVLGTRIWVGTWLVPTWLLFIALVVDIWIVWVGWSLSKKRR